MREIKVYPLIKSVSVIGTFTFISRCFGMIRDVLIFNLFGGTSLVTSAFYIAFTLPNLFRRLFGEGALSSSFIPIFIKTKNEYSLKEAWKLNQKIGSLLLITLIIITILGILIFVCLSNLNFLNDKWSTTIDLSLIMFPYLIFICLTSLCMGTLNALNHFVTSAFSPILLNLILIVCMIFVFPLYNSELDKVVALSWSVIIAGVAQLFFHFPIMIKKGAIFKFSNPFHDKKVNKVLFLMLPIALGAAVTQFNVIIDKFLAMYVGSWAPAALTFSERLIYLPLGIIATAFGTVLLPSFSEKVSKNDFMSISNTLINSIGFIFYLMTPAFIGLFVLSEPIIETIFKWNVHHEKDSIQHIHRALIFYSPGLIIFSLSKLLIPLFYSIQDVKTPVRIGLIVVFLNLLLNLFSIYLLPEFWKHSGLAFSTVLSEGVGIFMLKNSLIKNIPSLSFKGLLIKFLNILLRSVIMGVLVFIFHNFLTNIFYSNGKIDELLVTILSILFGITIYIILCNNLAEQKIILKSTFFRIKKNS